MNPNNNTIPAYNGQGTLNGTALLNTSQSLGVLGNSGIVSTGISNYNTFQTQGGTSYRNDIIVVLPDNVRSLDKKMVGLKEDTLYVTTTEEGKDDPNTYYIKKILGMNPETQQVEVTVTYHKLDFIKKYETLDINTGNKQNITEAGVSNEQLIMVLKHRLSVLNERFPCEENENAMKHLDYALAWLDKRTIDRLKRGVAGQHKV